MPRLRWWILASLALGAGFACRSNETPTLLGDADTIPKPDPSDDAGEPDFDAGACQPGSLFSTPKVVPAFDAVIRRGGEVRFVPGEKTAYYTTLALDGGNKRMFKTAYANPDKPVAAGTELTTFTFVRDQYGYVSVAPNERTLLYHETAFDGRLQITVASYLGDSGTSTSRSYGQFRDTTRLATFQPLLLPSEKAVYFVKQTDGTDAGKATGEDLYRIAFDTAKKHVTGAAEALDSLNTPSNEETPVVTDDEREIFFASDRTEGKFHVFYSTREDASTSFEEPIQLVDLDPVTDVRVMWISPDSCRLYLTGVDAVNVRHLWVATR